MEPPAEPKEYSVIAQERDVEGEQILGALEVVRDFISERKLVIYGGLAIDYALRLEGSGIYPEGERPDFDFFSPDSVKDAYDLAERLHERGFPRVTCIRAIHVQTMRVRVDFEGVADVSHVPPAIYESLPTLDYRGLRVLHPDYQRMDMHLAFCFPYNGVPREDIFHRYRKDLARFNLLSEHYPWGAPPPMTPLGRSLHTPPGGAAPHIPEASNESVALVVPKDAAVHGYHALEIMEAALAELEGRPPSGATVEGRTVTAPVPAGMLPALATPTPPTDGTHYRPYMDARPATVVKDGVVYYSTHWRQLAVFRYHGLLVVSPQYLLLYLLQHYFETGRLDFARDYARLLGILARGGELLAPRLAKLPGDEAERLLNSTPFGLGPQVLGKENYSEAYLVMLASEAQKIGDLQRIPAEFDAYLPDLDRLPQNYYLGRKTRPAPYLYESPLFHRDGGKIEDSVAAGSGRRPSDHKSDSS